MTRRGRGEGSISQRHDHPTCPPAVDGKRPEHHCRGRWVAVLDLGWAGGKRQRKVFYGRTRKEAQIKFQTANRKRGELVTGSPTVEAWLTYWLEVICPERGLKTNTLKSHRSKVVNYLIPNLGRHRLDKLEPQHIRAMYAKMREQGLAESTLRQTHAVLHRALKVAEREGKVGRNVAGLIDPPATHRAKRQGLTREQAWHVLTGGEQEADLRWWVALFLGLRQGEALALRWSDVDLDEGLLFVQRGLVVAPGRGLIFEPPKSEASRRFVPIPPVVLAAFKLAHHRHVAEGGAPDGLIFHRDGKPIYPRTDWTAWRDLLAERGVPHVALHAARNTTASLLEGAGVPARMVAQILGQSTVEVTYGYQSADLGRMREAMLELESYAKG